MNLHESFRTRLSCFLKGVSELWRTLIHIRIFWNTSGFCIWKSKVPENTDCQNSKWYVMGILAQEAHWRSKVSRPSGSPWKYSRDIISGLLCCRVCMVEGRRLIEKRNSYKTKPQNQNRLRNSTSCLMELINKWYAVDKTLNRCKKI